MDVSAHSEEGSRFLPRRRFGLPPTSSSSAPTTPMRSPNKLSLEEYEKEGREEARKELAALFAHLEANPELTKDLPHVARAMKENGKSSAQTERLRSLRQGSKSSHHWLNYVILCFIAAAIVSGVWYKLYNDTFSKSLPHAAQGAPSQLLLALKTCTENPKLYGLSLRDSIVDKSQKTEYNLDCLNLIDPVSRATPLHLAARYNSLANVMILLEAGAKTNVVDRAGLTPLHLSRSDEVTMALLKAGLDRFAEDHSGKTALFYCKSESQVLALTKGHPELFWKRDKTGASALHDSLRRAISSSNAQFKFAIEKAKYVVSHLPIDSMGLVATQQDAGMETPLSLIVELASLPDQERRIPSASLLSTTLVRLSQLKDEKIMEDVTRLDIPTYLIKADALGTLDNLLANKESISNFFNVSRLDSHGRYPISYVRSMHVLDLLVSHGAELHPGGLHNSQQEEKKENDPLHQILQSLSLHHASMAKQYQLVKALIEVDPKFEMWTQSVSKEMRTAIERRFVVVNAEPMEWSLSTLLLGLELLSEPSHQHYLNLKLNPQDYIEMPHLISPRSSAQFDVQIVHMTPGSTYGIDMEAKSAVDNINIQVTVGESQQAIFSSNSFFGAMPRIRLPIERRTMNSADPHFKILLQCANHLTSCSIDFTIHTYPIDLDSNDRRAPLIHSYFDYDFDLYSIARIATLLWLPASMAPKSIPVILRFFPFFASLVGFYPAGPIYLVYWLIYTTISHILVRLLGF
jgi:hypothetical protein